MNQVKRWGSFVRFGQLRWSMMFDKNAIFTMRIWTIKTFKWIWKQKKFGCLNLWCQSIIVKWIEARWWDFLTLIRNLPIHRFSMKFPNKFHAYVEVYCNSHPKHEISHVLLYWLGAFKAIFLATNAELSNESTVFLSIPTFLQLSSLQTWNKIISIWKSSFPKFPTFNLNKFNNETNKENL